MSYSLVPMSRFDRFVVRLRSFPTLHRAGKWLRRSLWPAIMDGFWEFARSFLAKSRNGPPSKTFSVYQALRCGWPKTNGRIVLHDQGVPKVTADSLLAKSGLEQYAQQPWPIFWSEHSGARLVTESLAHLTDDKALCVESVYGEKRWRSDTAGRFLKLPPPVKLPGNWTSIVSIWTPNRGVPIYGHWLHDALPRLALLPEFPPETRIIVPPNLMPYHKESLELLGVWDRCRPTPEQNLEVEHYFFSSPVGMIDCYNPYAVNWIRQALLPKKDTAYSGPKKFYLQRTSKKRPIENQDEICEFFRSQGWGIIKDVELTLAQTIGLFSEADALCSVLGSGMSNVMFCKPGCMVLHLVPDSFLDGWIEWIAETLKLNHHSLVLPCGGIPYGGTDLHRNVLDLELIKRFFASVNST